MKEMVARVSYSLFLARELVTKFAIDVPTAPFFFFVQLSTDPIEPAWFPTRPMDLLILHDLIVAPKKSSQSNAQKNLILLKALCESLTYRFYFIFASISLRSLRQATTLYFHIGCGSNTSC